VRPDPPEGLKPKDLLGIPGLFNALSERDGAGGAVKDVFSLSEGKPV
jgi:hypothetical protein